MSFEIDESDGDFALLSSTGARGIVGVILILLALVLYLIAASNSSECERHKCPEGQKAKLMAHECLCVSPAP